MSRPVLLAGCKNWVRNSWLKSEYSVMQKNKKLLFLKFYRVSVSLIASQDGGACKALTSLNRH